MTYTKLQLPLSNNLNKPSTKAGITKKLQKMRLDTATVCFIFFV